MIGPYVWFSRYGGRFDFSMITFQKIQEGAYGAIPWMIGCAVLGLVSLIILGSTHHNIFHTNCLPNWDSKGQQSKHKLCYGFFQINKTKIKDFTLLFIRWKLLLGRWRPKNFFGSVEVLRYHKWIERKTVWTTHEHKWCSQGYVSGKIGLRKVLDWNHWIWFS